MFREVILVTDNVTLLFFSTPLFHLVHAWYPPFDLAALLVGWLTDVDVDVYVAVGSVVASFKCDPRRLGRG